MPSDPTKRFSTRVENYIRYRPGYPEALLPLLEEHSSLRAGDVIADLGSGTGKLTERFLQRGYTVYAIEPNEPMREAARRLGAGGQCRLIDASAEATGLPDASIDLAVAAHGMTATALKRLFGPDRGSFHRLPNEQRLDSDGLIGRVLSASYAPEPGHPGHEEMIAALNELFRRHENNGEVVLRYRTEVYHGALYR